MEDFEHGKNNSQRTDRPAGAGTHSHWLQGINPALLPRKLEKAFAYFDERGEHFFSEKTAMQYVDEKCDFFAKSLFSIFTLPRKSSIIKGREIQSEQAVKKDEKGISE